MPNCRVLSLEQYTRGGRFQVFDLLKVIRSVRPHIVHSRNWGSIEAIFAARWAGVPAVVHSEHGYEVHTRHGLSAKKRAVSAVAFACAHNVFTVSSELREFYAANAMRSVRSINVLHNGVDCETFRPDADARAAWRKQLSIPEAAFVVGTVGRLTPVKDYPTLIRAFSKFVAQYPFSRLLFVGDGPQRQELEALSQTLGVSDRVIFTGMTNSAPQMLNCMDVFVLPSLTEGMSNSLLEAMATGLPVIATAVGGNPEIISPSCGRLFAPGDITALISHIVQLSSVPAERLQRAEAARAHVLSTFGMGKMASNYTQMYLDLLRRRNAMPAGLGD